MPQIASIPCKTLIVIQAYGLFTKFIRSRSLVILPPKMNLANISSHLHRTSLVTDQACNSCIPIPHEDRVISNSDLPRLSVEQSEMRVRQLQPLSKEDGELTNGDKRRYRKGALKASRTGKNQIRHYCNISEHFTVDLY